MERVARHLQTEAHSRRGQPEDFDLFGRSAFNRYYYAAFLVARQLMLAFNPTWKGSHSSLPSELTGGVLKKVRAAKKSALRIGDAQGCAICEAACSALHDLASLLRHGYSVRVIADYRPEIEILAGAGARFKLDRTDINVADTWPGKARAYAIAIERARKLANGDP